MNANQLTKIPLEKLSDTLQFLIAENEIPLSDALKQVIDDVDAVCKKLLQDELAPAQPVIPEQPEFYTNPDRFLPECLKLEEISGERRNSRIAELMGWFDRYYNGKANPKWLKSHAAELCYYILTVSPTAQLVSEPYKFHQGWIKGQFAYQDIFNAIAAAVVSKHPSMVISVKAFEDSMLAASPSQESE